MYPDLSYLLHDIFGTELDNAFSVIKTFGFMLAMAFLGSGWVLRSELKRYEEEGILSSVKKKISEVKGFHLPEFIINGLIAFFLGGKIPFIMNNFNDFKSDPASILFSKSGNWAIGVIVMLAYGAYYFFSNKGKSSKPIVREIELHPYQKSADIVIVSAISGVAGARLFSIFENLDGFAKDPIGTVFSGSGLTVYGGVIVGFIVVYWYVKKFGIKPIHMMDISGMAILVGLAIGRLGCQLSGDGDWGIIAAAQPESWFLPDWMWAYDYPNNVGNDNILMEGCNQQAYNEALSIRSNTIEDACEAGCGYRYCHELGKPVYPTPIYEVILYTLGFGILWIFRRRIKIAGILFFMYMIYNGFVRFMIEKIRVNDKYEILGFNWSQAQYISIAFILVGLAGIAYLIVKSKKQKT
jgi:prolipoprotein diacylglyceryltransferase